MEPPSYITIGWIDEKISHVDLYQMYFLFHFCLHFITHYSFVNRYNLYWSLFCPMAFILLYTIYNVEKGYRVDNFLKYFSFLVKICHASC